GAGDGAEPPRHRRPLRAAGVDLAHPRPDEAGQRGRDPAHRRAARARPRRGTMRRGPRRGAPRRRRSARLPAREPRLRSQAPGAPRPRPGPVPGDAVSPTWYRVGVAAYVEVAAFLPVRGTYCYSVPADLAAARVGARVLVPFGPRGVTGVIVREGGAAPAGVAVRAVRDLLDDTPA